MKVRSSFFDEPGSMSAMLTKLVTCLKLTSGNWTADPLSHIATPVHRCDYGTKDFLYRYKVCIKLTHVSFTSGGSAF